MTKENIEYDISVTFRHTESTAALKAYAIEKIQHCLERYVNSNANVQVILSVEKSDHIAEAKVHSRGFDVFAKGITPDLYSAIDKLVDLLDTQLRKQKEKHSNHKHQQATSFS